MSSLDRQNEQNIIKRKEKIQFYEQIQENLIFSASLEDDKIILTLDLKVDRKNLQVFEGVIHKAIQVTEIQRYLLEDIPAFYKIYFVQKAERYQINADKNQVVFQYNIKLGKPISGKIFVPLYKGKKIQFEQRLAKIERFYQILLKKQKSKCQKVVRQLNFVSGIDQLMRIVPESSDIDSLVVREEFKRKLVRKIKSNQEWSKLVFLVNDLNENPFSLNRNKGHITNYLISIQQQKEKKSNTSNIFSNLPQNLMGLKTAYIKIKQTASDDYLQLFNNNQTFYNNLPIQSINFKKVKFQVRSGVLGVQEGNAIYTLKCPVQFTIGLKSDNPIIFQLLHSIQNQFTSSKYN